MATKFSAKVYDTVAYGIAGTRVQGIFNGDPAYKEALDLLTQHFVNVFEQDNTRFDADYFTRIANGE